MNKEFLLQIFIAAITTCLLIIEIRQIYLSSRRFKITYEIDKGYLSRFSELIIQIHITNLSSNSHCITVPYIYLKDTHRLKSIIYHKLDQVDDNRYNVDIPYSTGEYRFYGDINVGSNRTTEFKGQTFQLRMDYVKQLLNDNFFIFLYDEQGKIHYSHRGGPRNSDR